MTTGTCMRCGRADIVEYGSDGQSYCSSCIFYGLNKQCVRCRMYLPASELQQFRGQWACPYCIQDMRSEDRRSEYHEERPKLEVIQVPEICERCGRDLEGRVYIWNNKKLCRKCVEDEQEKWGLVGGGPSAAPQKITLEPERRRRKESFLERLISDFLHVTGIRRRPRKVEIIEYGRKMPIQYAKPMSEKPMSKKDERKPVTEGPMGTERKAAPASKPVVAAENGERFFEEEKPKKRMKKVKADAGDPFFEFERARKKKK